MKKSETKFAARNKLTGEYAREGRETGMGRSIITTPHILEAKLSGSPAGLMFWMGGHYRATEAVPVTITTVVKVGAPVPYPAEDEVFE